jgi:cytochrome b involved in lipid metabolism
MKKTVGVFIVLFITTMGVMVGWGFIDKQIKEKAQPVQPQTNTQPNNANEATSGSTSLPAKENIYTVWDLSNHKTQNDCWIAINGNVYDVTKYLDQHPGGADLILMMCGKDATQAYKTQGGRGKGHSSRADALLSQFLIGKLN